MWENKYLKEYGSLRIGNPLLKIAVLNIESGAFKVGEGGGEENLLLLNRILSS